MEPIIFENRYYKYIMQVRDGGLYHLGFFPAGYENLPDAEELYRRSWPLPHESVICADSQSYMLPHGKRAYYGGVSTRAVFSHIEKQPIPGGIDNIAVLNDPLTGLEVRYHYQVYDDSPALVRFTEVVNRGTREVCLDHVSSFCLGNFPYQPCGTDGIHLHYFRSCWCYEGSHYEKSLADLEIYNNSRTSFSVESVGTWVCKDYIPFFIVEQRNTGLFTAFQLELSESWRFEIGNCEPQNGKPCRLYIQGGMTNRTHGGWERKLRPGEAFVAPKASMTVTTGNYENAVNLMHLHREKVLIRRNPGDCDFPVIYNDWLYLMGRNNEEAILKQLDTLKEAGADIYVTDDGWHIGWGKSLWTGLGHWEYDKERFPHGIEYVTAEIKKRGMRAGIWCEIEGIGSEAPLYNDETMLLMRNGHFVTSGEHRFLNFTRQKVRDYADRIFDRFAEWGFEYVKIDYNGDSVPGADNCGCENPADGLHRNREAYDMWLDGVRKRHPEMIIESCSSGGMRLEYNSLSHADLASITDQSDYRLLGALAANVTEFIHPSQCGIWSWTDCAEGVWDFVLAMTNSMIGRMHICGDFASLSDEKKSLLKEACAFYKSYRHIFSSCRTYHHTLPGAYTHGGAELRCTELRAENNAEAVVVAQRVGSDTDSVNVKFPGLLPGEYTVTTYPSSEPVTAASAMLASEGIDIKLPSEICGRAVYLRKNDN